MATGLSRADGLSAAGGNYRGSDEQRGGGRKKKWVRIGAGGESGVDNSKRPLPQAQPCAHTHVCLCISAPLPGPSQQKQTHPARAPPPVMKDQRGENDKRGKGDPEVEGTRNKAGKTLGFNLQISNQSHLFVFF